MRQRMRHVRRAALEEHAMKHSCSVGPKPQIIASSSVTLPEDTRAKNSHVLYIVGMKSEFCFLECIC